MSVVVSVPLWGNRQSPGFVRKIPGTVTHVAVVSYTRIDVPGLWNHNPALADHVYDPRLLTVRTTMPPSASPRLELTFVAIQVCPFAILRVVKLRGQSAH